MRAMDETALLSLLTPPAAAPPGVVFRPATVADLAALHAACYRERPWPHFSAHGERLLAWQENGRCHWLLAETKATETLVGSGQLLRYPHGAEVANLAVTPAWQGRGVGTALLRLFFRLGRRLGLSELEIGVDATNERALDLYRRLGFVTTRQAALPTGETAVFLAKSLIP
jgi:ribosomal protein S18 acetylase RimI-like enzyme